MLILKNSNLIEFHLESVAMYKQYKKFIWNYDENLWASIIYFVKRSYI